MFNCRNYQKGHIWQDLTDDDLITPFSDNEYILKGSLIPSPQNKAVEQFFPFNERNISTRKHDKEEEDEGEDEKEEIDEEEAYKPNPMTPYETLQIEANISPKPPPHGDEEYSPVTPADTSTSSSSEESIIRNKAVVNSGRGEEMKDGEKEKSCSEVVLKKSGSQVINKSSSMGRGEARRPRRRAVDVLRNLLRCRLVDTKDSVKRDIARNGSISKKNYQRNNTSNERSSSASPFCFSLIYFKRKRST